jgi:uncharacterized protein (UPF0335 family)
MATVENPRAAPGANSVSATQLKSFITRVEKLVEERAVIVGDIREVFAEAKAQGFDAKAIRQMIAIRKDIEQWKENEEIRDMYLHALGLI